MTVGTDIKLTSEQEQSVNYSAGDLLIRGVAGSGKSVVLMSRAVKLNQKANDLHEKKRIIILTYTNALVKYTQQLVSFIGLNPCLIELSSIDSLIVRCVHKIANRYYDIINDDEKSKYASLALQKHMETHAQKNHRFYSIDPQFWADEFDWMMQKDIRTLDGYINSVRTGRGTKVRVNKEDRTIAFEIFEIYTSLLSKNKKKTWEDLYQYAWDNRDRIPESIFYDFVLIDEAQDLSFVQLRFAKYITRKAITIAADNAQKIYNKSFSWKDLGIDIRGHASKKLSVTFRNTAEIWRLAESLQNVNRLYHEDGAEYTESTCPTESGTKPRIYQCINAADENNALAVLIKKLTSQNMSIGILYRTYEDIKPVVASLKSSHVPYQWVSNKSQWDLSVPGAIFCTMHSSKGLEFDIVLIPHFSSSSIPPEHMLNNTDNEEIGEFLKTERSLLYVAMSRARKALIFTYCGVPSPFMSEFDPEYYDYATTDGKVLEKPKRVDNIMTVLRPDISTQQKKNESEKSVQKPAEPVKQWRPAKYSDFWAGRTVKHKKFGEGTITELKGSGKNAVFSVLFINGETKSFSADGAITGKFFTAPV